MMLILEVLPPQDAVLGSASRHVFSRAGGTIGRGSGNDWVLSHRKVSGRHALISFQDGAFYIVDEGSANGVFINTMTNRLVPGKRYALRAGDRILIDPYEITVTISTGPADDPGDWNPANRHATPPAGYDPFAPHDPFGEPAPRARTPGPWMPGSTPPPGEAVPVEEVDPLKLLGGSPKPPPAPPGPRARDLEQSSPLAAHYRPPAVPPQPAPAPAAPLGAPPPAAPLIPADYDPLGPDEPETPGPSTTDDPFAWAEPVATPAPEWPPAPSVRATPPPAAEATPAAPPPRATPPPAQVAEPRAVTPVPVPPEPALPPPPTPPPAIAAPPVPATPAPDAGLVEVLRGAGLEHAPVTLEFARSFGQIFRVVVAGVMDVLRARSQVKDEFRMRLTQFRPADNNPLKFSANVDDALHNLLVKRNAAYLEPVEAFEDAFEDLRHHQLAMLAGMRVAFETLLAQFNPDMLQEQFDRQLKRGGLLAMTSRLRYWDLFRERYEEMMRDPDTTFRRLFGEEFAKAYDEQLRRLKSGDR